jgi:hypothetical protein
MKALIGILVLIIGILMILALVPGMTAAAMYFNWINAILILIIGILVLMKKK